MMATQRKIPEYKVKMLEELVELLRKYRVFALADLAGVPANHIQMLRKKLNKVAEMRVVKPKIAMLALKKAGYNPDLFAEYLTGQVLMIFTNMNAFELNNIIEKHVTKAYYKPGEKADKEIVIPEGNTGIPPGPMLSVFGKLKIPTKVQGNVVHVAKDTVVAKPGDVISPELSSLLQKLGMALKEIRLPLRVAFDWIVIPGDKLKLNIDEYVEELKLAHLDAVKIAVEIALPEPGVIELVIQKAHRYALSLAAEAAFITPETAEHVLRMAQFKALALAGEISRHAPELGLQVATPAQPAAPVQAAAEEKKEEKKEESKELSEESLAEGFAALFG